MSVSTIEPSPAEFKSSAQPMSKGYLANPTSDPLGAVLVLHAWWGLNSDTMAFCDQLADAGFATFAPDMFDGQTADTPSGANALVDAYSAKHLETKALISEAAKALAEQAEKEEIGVVGFSFGAYYALYLSNAEPALVRSVVVFYGTGHDDFTASEATYLGHFAENDDFEPAESVGGLTKLLHDAGRPARIHVYPDTGHWFFEQSISDAYNPDAARLAWERTLEFLQT